ncbi:hypothetical protein ACQEVF_45985 [Nonomuraea polychroma]|uniref:hypothetical protein n=1 Tax=Nonomuraea polychroma TaxID=46176 RepID=UPI003D8CF005
MSSLARHRLTPAETGPALRALCEWTPADAPGGGLHPGDVGWHLRFDDAAVFLWIDDVGPVAAGFLDGPVLRVTAAPGADLGALAADAEELLEPGNDWSDGLPVPGWDLEQEEPWLVMSWTPRPVSSRAEPVDEAGAADRVLVQRSAFAGSTFTVERWRTMKRSPAGGLAVEALVRTPAGEPAAAATGWFAGVGVRAARAGRHPSGPSGARLWARCRAGRVRGSRPSGCERSRRRDTVHKRRRGGALSIGRVHRRARESRLGSPSTSLNSAPTSPGLSLRCRPTRRSPSLIGLTRSAACRSGPRC